MTREELKAHCKKQIEMCEFWTHGKGEELNNNKIYQEHKLILELLEQESTDCVSRQFMYELGATCIATRNENGKLIALGAIDELPSVTPQEPRCKECKWWKDSDGEYRRGIGAESQCPINRREVFEGNGYCYIYEPQESEAEDGECI